MGFRVHQPAPGCSLIEGDSREALRVFKADRFDSVVSDPPYELGFMGKGWDASGIAFDVEFWREVLRVLKPGGHLLAFGGTRTYHRMACAIEDAGFEVRDEVRDYYSTDAAFAAFYDSLNRAQRAAFLAAFPAESSLTWNFGTGFPKSLNVGEGRGTALKPAHEPIVMARKPLIGTVAANVAAHGTGAINVDACRIPGEAWKAHRTTGLGATKFFTEGEAAVIDKVPHDGGRWPANVLLDEDAAAELDAQSGVLTSGLMKAGTRRATRQGVAFGRMSADTTTTTTHGDSGGASRFFYVAKPSRSERDQGCAHLPAKSGGEATDRVDDSKGTQNPRAGAGRTGGARNFHPTVKPVDLMRYLVRLVTPPGGCVLDPFTGSGTTGMAARLEGLSFVGVEREPEYATIAAARIASAAPDAEEAA